MRIVFLGPPGAGKGTQAVRLAKALSVPHISTGDMLRAAAAGGTDLGRRVKAIIESGALVDDGTMEGVVAERLAAADCARGFLLDGYPRTVAQAAYLAGLLGSRGSSLAHVCLFDVPRDELIERMLKRGRDTGRTDDTRETILRRLDVYTSQTEPLRAYYERAGLLRVVNGTGSPEDVWARLQRAAGAGPR
ncbi:MAG: adenylate kinase [Planctomycetes bacterium]|nr:adenylate kinase [Planctomycetota bacterium]